MGRWNAGTAKNSILSIAGPTLSNAEKTAIEAVFNKLKW
jgi:GTP-sensing pleiotropic transcriptional regulator CodY